MDPVKLSQAGPAGADDERFAAKMHVVRESVEMHMEEEEEEAKLLPRLEKLLDKEDRSRLGEALLAAKESAPNHPDSDKATGHRRVVRRASATARTAARRRKKAPRRQAR